MYSDSNIVRYMYDAMRFIHSSHALHQPRLWRLFSPSGETRASEETRIRPSPRRAMRMALAGGAGRWLQIGPREKL